MRAKPQRVLDNMPANVAPEDYDAVLELAKWMDRQRANHASRVKHA